MFTGLIQERSQVVSRTEKSGGLELTIQKPISWTDP
jgi:riboflavin synthase alpha subunit